MKLIQKPSQHFDERKTPIDMVVIHATESPTLAYTFELLLGSKAPNRISAHYVIDRDGTMYQLVAQNGVNKMSPFMFLQIIFTIAVGVIFYHKHITIHVVLGAIVAAFGVYLTTRKRKTLPIDVV